MKLKLKSGKKLKQLLEKLWRYRDRVRSHPNAPNRIFLYLFTAGYALFFTSPIWFPESEDLIPATPYYKRETYENYQMYLTEWEYAAMEGTMEIILELENNEVLDQKLLFTAVERTKGDLEIKPVLEESEYVVLRLENVPTNWKEISLRAGKKGDQNPVKFYTNVREVKETKTLPKQEKKSYQIERLQAQIAYDDAEILKKEKEIGSLKKENERLDQKMEELQEGSYLSEEEVRKAEETITKARNQKKLNEDTIYALTEKIKSLTERSKKILEQIEILKQ